MIRVLTIRVVDRIKESGHTQEVLTTHSHVIQARLGFHELNEQICSREGYIALLLKDDISGYEEFIADLNKIYGIETKEIVLCSGSDMPDRVPEEAKVSLAGVRVDNRKEAILDVQNVLTLFGCSIRTRMGVNISSESIDSGVILLDLIGDNNEINMLAERLFKLPGVCLGLTWFE